MTLAPSSGVFTACAFLLLCACGRDDAVGTPSPAPPVADAAARNDGEPEARDDAIAARTFGDVHRGEATYYRATGKGNCSFDASDDVMVAAINTADYATGAMCGAYVAVSGPEGEVTVRVVDRCPACKPGDLDLSRQAFSRIAAPAAGRVAVTWRIVAGTVPGPLAYHYMEGSTRYWTAIQVRDHRWPVAALDIMPEGATDWIAVERRAYNYFVHPRPIASGPVRVRVTAVTGAVVEDVLPEPAGGLTVQGAAQFR